MANVDPKLIEEIKKYLLENDLPSVKRCVLENPNLLECDVDEGDTLLSYSLGQKKEEVASWLISIGARISGHDLAIAAWSGLVEMTRFLMTKTHDPIDEETMCFICSLGRTRVAQLLLESGEASADSLDYNGNSSLMEASANGDIDMVRLLLKHGANVNYLHPGTGQSALVFMCGRIADGRNEDRTPDYLGVLELLIVSGAELDTQDCGGQTALLRALSIPGDTGREKGKLARALIEAGARVDIATKEAFALGLACEYPFDAELVRLLLEHGADPNEHTEFQNCALMLACEKGDLEKVKILVEYGARINEVDAGETALLAACRGMHVDVVKFLIERGVDVNFFSGRGYTPLVLSCYNGSIDIIGLLLDNGANIDMQDKDGDCALIIASWCNFPQVVHLLISRGANLELRRKGVNALETVKRRLQNDRDDEGFQAIKALLEFAMHNEVALVVEKELALPRQVLIAFYESNILTLEDCKGLTESDLITVGIHSANFRQRLLERFAEL